MGNVLEQIPMAKKIEEVRKIHPYRITPPTGSNKRWQTRYRDENGKYKEDVIVLLAELLEDETITAEKIIEERLVPSQMAVGSKIVHRLNGNVEINISDLGEKYFIIKFEELGSRACVGLSQINWNNNGITDLFQIKINDKEFKLPIPMNGLDFDDEGALPITVKKATDSCNKGSNNVIVWTFQ